MTYMSLATQPHQTNSKAEASTKKRKHRATVRSPLDRRARRYATRVAFLTPPPNFGYGMLFRTLEAKDLMSIRSHCSINRRYATGYLICLRWIYRKTNSP